MWLHPTFPLTLFDAFTLVNVASSTAMSRTIGADKHFFALTAHSFKTTMIQQQDGYTIMFPCQGVADAPTAPVEGGMAGGQNPGSRAIDFVLWNVSST